MPDKLDLKQEYADYYKAGKDPEQVKLGAGHFLALDGHGAPGEASFQNAIATLYAVAYDVRAGAKASDADFVVPPCEAQFWVTDKAGKRLPMKDWTWRVLIRMPPGTTNSHVEHAKDRIGAKRGDLPAMKVTYERIHEGDAVQVLHKGPYDQEESTIRRLLDYAAKQGLTVDGPHHRVYLSDPNRTAPEDLKTILRVPVK